MSTPNEPQNPYGEQPEGPADPFRKPEPAQPTVPPYGAPAAPQYGGPQYGAPQYAAQYQQGPYGVVYPRNGLAVWALVLGICSFVLSCGLFTGIPAVIVGNKARNAVARGEANNGGMATAGIILGWIAIGLSILGVIVVIGLFSNGDFRQGFEDGMNG